MSWVIKADTIALPRITFTVFNHGVVETKDFFFDARLDEYRPVDNPGERYTMQQMDDMIDAAEEYMNGLNTRGTEEDPEFNFFNQFSDDDYVISDSGKGYYCAQVGTNVDFDGIIQEISDDMVKKNLYGDVYYVNDHGNLSLLKVDRNKNGVATSEEVKSWV